MVFARGLRDVVGRFASLSAPRNDDRAHFDTQTGSFAFLCSRTRRFGAHLATQQEMPVSSAVAGAFYPANAGELQAMIDRQMNHARRLVSSLAPRLPQGAPKAVIVPHAGYMYSGSVAALAYALLERTPHSARRAGRA